MLVNVLWLQTYLRLIGHPAGVLAIFVVPILGEQLTGPIAAVMKLVDAFRRADLDALRGVLAQDFAVPEESDRFWSASQGRAGSPAVARRRAPLRVSRAGSPA